MMDFSQSIYFNDTPLILTTSRKDYISKYPGSALYSFFTGTSSPDYEAIFQNLEKTGATGAIIEDTSADALLTKLQTMFHRIDAGGGVAYNELGEILMIFRRGKWDLPKG